MDELNKRVEKLEEKHAFAEHAADQLSAELVRAYEQMERLMKRLEALENRLGSLEQGGEEIGE